MKPSKRKVAKDGNSKTKIGKIRKRGKEKLKAKTIGAQTSKKKLKIKDSSPKDVYSGAEREVITEGEKEETGKVIGKPQDVRFVLFKPHAEYHGIILLEAQEGVAIQGTCTLKVLFGTATVNGYELTVKTQDLPVFSLPSSSLYIVQENGKDLIETVEPKSLLDGNLANLIKDTERRLLSQKFAAVVLVKKVHSFCRDFISTVKRFDRLGSKEIQVLPRNGCLFPTLQTDKWDQITEEIFDNTQEEDLQNSRIVICGATDLGKSSFGRYLVNRLLSRASKNLVSIYYLDCDLGQSEFTPPGCISLTEVNEPLVGPPFTHLKRPSRCQLFGETSPKDRPYFYIDCILDVFKYYRKYCRGPLIVNTQGWVKGLGFPLLIDVLRIVKPRLIVQFTCPSNPSKRMCTLSNDVIHTAPGWGYQNDADEDSTLPGFSEPENIRYLEIESFQRKQDENTQTGFKVSSADYRRLAALSYFGDMQQASYKASLQQPSSLGTDWFPRPFEDLVPFQVRLQDIAVHVPQVHPEKESVLKALNFSLVGLVQMEKTSVESAITNEKDINILNRTPKCKCIGYGIVRNIDVENDMLYLLTPEPKWRLETVNAIVKAGLEIPDGLFQQHRKFYQMTASVQQVCGAKALKPRFNLLRRSLEKNAEISADTIKTAPGANAI